MCSSKPIKRIPTRVNPNVHYGLSLIMMCQCRFINCKKHTTLVGDADNREGYAYVGHRVYGKSLTFLSTLL